MTIVARYRDAPGIEEEAAVVLVDWSIFELPGGSRHFCGFHAGAGPGKGRVSSGIVRFDPDTLTGTTGSGRAYRLEGQADERGRTDIVRVAWMVAHGLDPACATPVEPEAAAIKPN